MTCSIVRLLEGKDSVRLFSFNLFISASNISAPKPPKCPPNLMGRSREWWWVFRKEQAQHNFHWRQFCVTRSTLIKKSKSFINFVLHFLDKQWNVLHCKNYRHPCVTRTHVAAKLLHIWSFYNCFACCRRLNATSWSSAIFSCRYMLRSLLELTRKLSCSL